MSNQSYDEKVKAILDRVAKGHLSTEEAATLIADAIVHRPPRVATRLGMFARVLELFAPKIADAINNVSFRMFPDSQAARGLDAAEEAPTEEAVAFARLLHGLHW